MDKDDDGTINCSEFIEFIELCLNDLGTAYVKMDSPARSRYPANFDERLLKTSELRQSVDRSTKDQNNYSKSNGKSTMLTDEHKFNKTFSTFQRRSHYTDPKENPHFLNSQ